MRIRFCVLFLTVLSPLAELIAAPSPRASDQNEVIAQLLARIDQLEQRVADLERGKSPPEPPPVAAQPLLPKPSEAAEADTFPSLRLRGFADIDFAATNRAPTISANNGFSNGALVLHLTSPLSKRVNYFGELTMIAEPAGIDVEIERSFIRYDYNDAFKVSFGKFHTPITYWNTAFHRGFWTQTTVKRPGMTDFDQHFLPEHFVGFVAEGKIPSGPLGLAYNTGIGNGRGRNLLGEGDFGDSDNNRAWVVSLVSRPPRFYGLQVGGSAYHDRITLNDGRSYKEWIGSAHFAFVKERAEVIAEFADVRHQSTATRQVNNSPAAYGQVAYRLPWMNRRLKPYYRYEWVNVALSEPVFGGFDGTGSTVGMRWDISDFAAFKGEYRNTRVKTHAPYTKGLFLQTAFTF